MGYLLVSARIAPMTTAKRARNAALEIYKAVQVPSLASDREATARSRWGRKGPVGI